MSQDHDRADDDRDEIPVLVSQCACEPHCTYEPLGVQPGKPLASSIAFGIGAMTGYDETTIALMRCIFSKRVFTVTLAGTWTLDQVRGKEAEPPIAQAARHAVDEGREKPEDLKWAPSTVRVPLNQQGTSVASGAIGVNQVVLNPSPQPGEEAYRHPWQG